MKVGDLVKLKNTARPYGQSGIIVEIIHKKVHRVAEHGKSVDWSKLDPEPHGVVLFAHNSGTINIPTSELELV